LVAARCLEGIESDVRRANTKSKAGTDFEGWKTGARAGKGAVFSIQDITAHDAPHTKIGRAKLFSKAIQKHERRKGRKRKPLQDEGDGISAVS
jgi:hypothetical protein